MRKPAKKVKNIKKLLFLYFKGIGGGKKVVEIFTFNDAPQKIRVTSFYRIKKYSFFAILWQF